MWLWWDSRAYTIQDGRWSGKTPYQSSFSVFSTYVSDCGGLPQWLSCKESACKAGDIGDVGSIPGSGRSPGGHGILSVGESHGQRSLVGYSPWGRKELGTTEGAEYTQSDHGSLGRYRRIASHGTWFCLDANSHPIPRDASSTHS